MTDEEAFLEIRRYVARAYGSLARVKENHRVRAAERNLEQALELLNERIGDGET